MTGIIQAIHIALSVALILLVLLHAGRGGGVSEMCGGGMQSQAMGSTVMEKNLQDHGDHRGGLCRDDGPAGLLDEVIERSLTA